MPIPLIGAAIAGTAAVVGGRLVKAGIETHNKMQKIERMYHKGTMRNTGGIKGSGGANVNPDYK